VSFIKRVVGFPATSSRSGPASLLVNGFAGARGLPAEGFRDGGQPTPTEVRKGYYFVLGTTAGQQRQPQLGEVPGRYHYGRAGLPLLPFARVVPIR